MLAARLVVGADGRNSAVARLAGSRKYNVTANERFFYWSFFAGADPGAEPAVVFHHWSGTFEVSHHRARIRRTRVLGEVVRTTP